MAEASSGQVNQVANLVSQLGRAIETVDSNVREVEGHVERISAQQNSLSQELNALRQQMQQFMDADRMQKAVQLAETRVVKVRQELDTRYGHYREVRRRATGILQALDAALVTHESIQDTTEDVMMRTPGYWLAPALVALASWIRDERDLAVRALEEALRRDEHRTSLFFALVLRRYQREQSSVRWVRRYFSKQDPTNLDRDCMIVLDAVTNGAFGPVAQSLAMNELTGWIELLEAEPGFVDEQHRRWRDALVTLQPAAGGAYEYLPTYSPDWSQLADRLGRARLHGEVKRYFHDAFDGEIPLSPRLAEQVDGVLESLVTNFDGEELPLRRQERELQLIIDCHGDEARAASLLAAEEESFQQNVSFAGLLTNAAMHSEQSGASPATQRLAIALSHKWIITAYDEVVADGRARIPEVIHLEIDDWSCETEDGSNEGQLVDKQRDVYSQRAAAARESIKLSGQAIAAGVLGGVAVLLGLLLAVSWVLVLLGAGGGVYAYLEYRKLGARREEAERKVWRAHRKAEEVLRASLAEVVDWRREWADADAEAEAARAELNAIRPEQHTKTHENDSRGVMTS